MKPAPFRYFRPSSVQEAVELLERYGDGAKILAGGQSLVPVMNMRLSQPEVVVDINWLSDLNYASIEGNVLKIGALVRQRTLEMDSRIKRQCPVLSLAARFIGHPATRNRGTVVGSIVHADPAAELPLLLVTLDGELVVQSSRGTREIPARNLYLGPLLSAVNQDELAVEVRFPVLSEDVCSTFVEFAQRFGDFALVATAVVIRRDVNGQVVEARIGVGGAGPVPYRAEEAERLLLGSGLEAEAIEEAAHLAAEQADPFDDAHASRGYRKNLVRVLVKRALLDLRNREGGAHYNA